MLTRYFALAMGILFILAGVGGFVPLVTAPPPETPTLTLDTSYGLLLGLFPINLLHNLIHLSFGIWGVAASRTFMTSRQYARWLAVILAIFMVMGIISPLSTGLGLAPMFGHDIWLHGLEAVVAGYLGYLMPLPNKTVAVSPG